MDVLDRQREIARRVRVREYSVVRLVGRSADYSVCEVYVLEKGLPCSVRVIVIDGQGCACGNPFVVGLGEVERVVEY